MQGATVGATRFREAAAHSRDRGGEAGAEGGAAEAGGG